MLQDQDGGLCGERRWICWQISDTSCSQQSQVHNLGYFLLTTVPVTQSRILSAHNSPRYTISDTFRSLQSQLHNLGYFLLITVPGTQSQILPAHCSPRYTISDTSSSLQSQVHNLEAKTHCIKYFIFSLPK